MTTVTKFTAKKVKENSFALFENGTEFARVQHIEGKWLLSTANTELKRLFDATVLTADATLQAVLWTIRAILEHIAELAAAALRTVEAAADAAKFATEFEPVYNPRNGRVAFAPRNAVLA